MTDERKMMSEPVAWAVYFPSDKFRGTCLTRKAAEAFAGLGHTVVPLVPAVVTEEMVERAARALCLRAGCFMQDPTDGSPPPWKEYEGDARAALTAALGVE